MKEQDDPLLMNNLNSAQDNEEDEDLLNDNDMRLDFDDLLLSTNKAAASRNSRKLTDLDEKKHFATDTNNRLEDLF